MVQQIKSQIIGWRKFLNKDSSSQKVSTARNHNNNDNSKIKVVIITMTRFIISIKKFIYVAFYIFSLVFSQHIDQLPVSLLASVGRALHRYRRGDGFKSSKGPNFLQVLFSTTSSVVFLIAKISQIRFFTAVQIYEFHISKIIIRHLDGLFGPNIFTSSQLAC